MKYLVAIIIFLSVCSINAQTINPQYDKALADSLGADENGMKGYIFVILKTGKNTTVEKEEKTKLFQGHMNNIKRLVAEGKLFVAGPFGKNELTYRGLFILNVKTVEEAKQLCDTDPAIKAGIFDVELIPWYGSAALGEYIKVSEKIAKFKM
jgi:uncharacterized protein YciI